MKDLVIETIKLYYGDLEGHTTEEFYKDYLEICKENNVEPEDRRMVIRRASDLSGCYSKRYCINKFARKEG